MPRGSPDRIPALDGIRAIAILLVIVQHSLGTGSLPDGQSDVRHTIGDLGVRTFFVLSGFLITTLLIREHARTGTIALRAFFIRRTVRIFPAFFAYLGVMALLGELDVIALPRRELVWAATYTMNFHTPETWWVGHLWSLAVEEQFYLVWPLAVALLGISRAPYLAAAAIVGAPMLRIAARLLLPELDDEGDHAFPFVFDALAIGCLLALVRARLESVPRYLALLHARAFWLFPLAAIVTFTLVRPWPLVHALGISLANVAIVLVLHRLVLTPTGAIGRVLERPSLVWLGTLSYSLYLWQQPVLNRHLDAWQTSFPLNLALALALGCASHYLVERPVLRWRQRSADRRRDQIDPPVP